MFRSLVRQLAHAHGYAATFMDKPFIDQSGSGFHTHYSLWKDGKNAFHDPAGEYGMSDLMKSYMAGLIKYAPDVTYFLAPYVNSYKRFMKGTFAPTKTVWSVDNRTAGFRLCGEGTKAVRVECRIGGSDINPYLALATQLAAGLAGIEEGLALRPPTRGDVYEDEKAGKIPESLREAVGTLSGSAMLRAALGDFVVDHYTRCANWELEEFDRIVTDWEIARGFEKA